MNLKVLTCISKEKDWGYLNLLKASCEFFGLELIVQLHEGTWTTHRLKDHYLLKMVRKLRADEIVLFTDGYDTMFQCSEEEILLKFRAFGSSLVFSAEKNCWPYPELHKLYPYSETEFKFLNCGAFIGEAGVIRTLLERYPSTPSKYNFLKKAGWNFDKLISKKETDPDKLYRWSNQYYWTWVYLQNRDIISLDHNTDIFLECSTKFSNLFPNGRQGGMNPRKVELVAKEKERINREFEFRDGRVISRSSQSTPCHLHFNGPIAKQIAMEGHFRMVMPWLEKRRHECV